MARPREFDSDEAVNRAMNVFWAKGYSAASMDDLASAMGLSRSSIYATFGSKHDLFLSAIDRYNGIVTRDAVDLLTGPTPGRDAIRILIEELIERLSGPAHRRGCLVCNSAIELAPHDRATRERVLRAFTLVEDSFMAAIERGRKAGDITSALGDRALARFLVSNINGFLVLAKAGVPAESLHETARVVLAAFD
ncbi:MAG: TetR/AcrR family transcriptional regulator [Rhodospirillales bacterium]|nr:TetR/AcrR family transcriptional regulator [Rhodospirillales bacterium]